MKRIFLIGYMGAGKTTLGRELAKAMELNFIDLDHYIQEHYQKTVSELFEEYGEEGFRNIESKVLAEISNLEDVVISSGGGTPCFNNNIELMNNSGLTIYLEATPEALAERLETCKGKRPLIKDKNKDELLIFIQQSLSERDKHYSKAQIIFRTDELISREDADKHVKKIISLLSEN